MERDAGFTQGAPAPLFDRLVDDAPHEAVEERPFRVLSETQLFASIKAELANLLNTRTDVSEEVLWSDQLTVLDYGLPDFSSWYTRSESDRNRLARYVTRVIAVFEPRLLQPAVTVRGPEKAMSTGSIRLSIGGYISTGSIRTPVSFNLDLDSSTSTS